MGENITTKKVNVYQAECISMENKFLYNVILIYTKILLKKCQIERIYQF